jgi:hypothetical protein
LGFEKSQYKRTFWSVRYLSIACWSPNKLAYPTFPFLIDQTPVQHPDLLNTNMLMIR